MNKTDKSKNITRTLAISTMIMGCILVANAAFAACGDLKNPLVLTELIASLGVALFCMFVSARAYVAYGKMEGVDFCLEIEKEEARLK